MSEEQVVGPTVAENEAVPGELPTSMVTDEDPSNGAPVRRRPYHNRWAVYRSRDTKNTCTLNKPMVGRRYRRTIDHYLTRIVFFCRISELYRALELY